ncbi:MAG: T9SS type A sorting domain-containing protein, partial [Bacteroidota bacterium]
NVFPNPATDIINIQYELDENSNASFNVFNSIGQVVVNKIIANDEQGIHQVSLSVTELNMSRGIYFVELLVNGNKYLKKVAVVE